MDMTTIKDAITAVATEHKLSPWEIVQIARNTKRPQAKDYIEGLFSEVDYIMGDRVYGDDPALLGGWADFMGQPIVFLGQQKGKSIQERLDYNSGMMHPEGYRKAHRLALMAEKFQAPLVTFIDTPGAFPGIDAEKRGQSMAIAENLKLFSRLKTPIINIIIGEGCSGGALGIGVGDLLWMMEFSYFSVISPEGCASILFKSPSQSEKAAKMMRLTAPELMEGGFIDKILKEPSGGAHNLPEEAIASVRLALHSELSRLVCKPIGQLVKDRYTKIINTSKSLPLYDPLS